MQSATEILNLAADRYGEQLYWHIRRLVVSHDDAEDALQETFIRIFTKAASFRGEPGSLPAWFYRIATNEALQILRKRVRLFQSVDDLSDTLSELIATESAPDASKASVLFQKATMQLPTRQRIAFNLRYYDDLSYEEIARITGSSEGSLRTNYHYAVKTIRKYLEDHTI